jgi:signal transduction histidine kinase
MPRAAIAAALDELRQDTANVTDDVHRLSHRLHSATLDHLGLVPALQRLADDFSTRTSISVEFTHEPLPANPPPDVALCLFRIAQESLNNVAKHSQARSAHVHLLASNDGIRLTVEDDGVGFDMADLATVTGLGFVSMGERLRVLHGTLRVDSAPGRGTRIEAAMPATGKLPAQSTA